MHIVAGFGQYVVSVATFLCFTAHICYSTHTMKQLQLTPPLLILVMGYPGAGKTFFARQFAEQFELPRISEDVIRFELFEEPQFNADEIEIITRMRDYALGEVMKTGQTAIVEGAFMTQRSRYDVYRQAKSAGYQVLTVWLQTDVQTSASRATKRDRRNADSKYSFSLTKDQFEALKAQLQRPSEREDSVVISGKHAFKSQSLTVLKKIAGTYSEQLSQNRGTSPERPPQVSRRNNQLIQ